MSKVGPLLVLAMIAFLAGCDAGPRPDIYAARVVDSPDTSAVLNAAAGVFQREFGRATLDRAHGRITAVPVEFQSSRDAGLPRDLVGAPSTLRRVASCLVQKQGNGTVARVRIDIERRDTQRREVSASVMATNDDPLSDRPTYGGASSGAARTVSQNESWTRVRRDTELERAILDELVNQFAPDEAVGAAASQPVAR